MVNVIISQSKIPNMNYALITRKFSTYACVFCALSFFLLSFTPVSVVFTSLLKGEKTVEGNKLTWTTSSEIDCSLFMIEKSRDGINYSTLATLPATDSDDTSREYHYFDKQEKGMRVFYRLVNVEDNGTGSFSHEVVLSEKGENAKFFMNQVAASATHQDYFAKVDCKTSGALSYRVMTNMGDLLIKGESAVVEGINEIEVPTSQLPVGTYQLALKLQNDIEVFKIKKLNSPAFPETNFVQKN